MPEGGGYKSSQSKPYFKPYPHIPSACHIDLYIKAAPFVSLSRLYDLGYSSVKPLPLALHSRIDI